MIAPIPLQPVSGLGASSGPPRATAPEILETARTLEVHFLAEMFQAAGLARPREGLGGGGAGEAQFASFLCRAQAESVVKAGGIGLARQIADAIGGAGHERG